MNNQEASIELLQQKAKTLNIIIKSARSELIKVSKEIGKQKINLMKSKVTNKLKDDVLKITNLFNRFGNNITDKFGSVKKVFCDGVGKVISFGERTINLKNNLVNKVNTVVGNVKNISKDKLESIKAYFFNYYFDAYLRYLEESKKHQNTPIQDQIDKSVGIIREENKINKYNSMFNTPLANIDIKAKKIVYNGMDKALTFQSRMINFKNNSINKVSSFAGKIKTGVKNKIDEIKYYISEFLEKKSEYQNTPIQDQIDKSVGIIREENKINKYNSMFNAPLANIDIKVQKIVYNGIGKALTFQKRAINFKNNSINKINTGVSKVSSYVKNFVKDKADKIKSAFVPDMEERKMLIQQLEEQKAMLLAMKEENRELNHSGLVRKRSMGFVNNTGLLFIIVGILSVLAVLVAIVIVK